MAHLVFFSPERIALQRELVQHPDLAKKLANCEHPDFETNLCEIASWFGIIVDGAYMPEELDKLAEILTKRLYERRSMIILPPSQ